MFLSHLSSSQVLMSYDKRYIMDNIIDIKFEIDIVTGETIAHFIISILELLLYQRNQIPFVCKTFKYLVDKWDKPVESDAVPDNFQLEREKTSAKQTMDGIKSMTEVLKIAFERSDISSVRFLFGATPITPKESYTINIPSISRNHSFEHHKLKASLYNKALISLVTSEILHTTFSSNLCPTNVFLELKMPDVDANGWEQLISTDFHDLPPSCKQFVINLIHMLPADFTSSKCCQELKVFQDISNLSLQSVEDSVECWTEASKQIGWWEASTIVRGFKQKTLKGSNLWQ